MKTSYYTEERKTVVATESIRNKEDFDFFEIPLRRKEDVARAREMGCEIFYKQYQIENGCYGCHFIRVPKDAIFANAEK